MPEVDPFDVRLSDELKRLADQSVLPGDPMAIASAVLGAPRQRRERLPRFALVGLAAALGFLIAVILGQLRGQNPQSGTPSASFAASGAPSQSVAPSPTLEPQVSEVALPITDFQTQVNDLAYDPEHNAIWFSGFDGQQDPLFRLDTKSGMIEKWLLPEGDYWGVYQQVKVDETGFVWLTGGYRILRFDPITKESQTIDFPLHVPEELNDAFDGTWISSIAPIGDGLLVARHNVPYLTRLDSDLSVVGTIPVPAGDEGALDLAVVGEVIYVLRDFYAGAPLGVDLLRLDGSSRAFVEVAAGRLEVDAGRVLLRGSDRISASIGWLTPDGDLDVLATGIGAFPDPRGGVTIFGRLENRNTVLKRVVDGEAVSQLIFEGRLEPLNRCPGLAVPPSSSPAETPSSCPDVWIVEEIHDLVTDRDGVSWYVLPNARAVYRVEL